MKYQGSCIRLLLTASASAAFSKQNRWVCFLPSFFFFPEEDLKVATTQMTWSFFVLFFQLCFFPGNVFQAFRVQTNGTGKTLMTWCHMENGLLETHASSLYSFQNSRLHKHTLISEKPGKNICSRLKIWQEKKFHFSISISFFLFKKAVRCLLSEACLHQQMWTLQSVEAYLYTTVTGKSQKNTSIRSLSTKRHQNSFGASDSTGHVYEVTPEVTHDVTVPLKTLPSSSGQKTCKNETTTHLKNLKLWCPQLPRFMRNREQYWQWLTAH